jgi:hypothetical protein
MTDRITIDDVRKAGHCALGARRWFESHGLDFRDFLKNGIETERLLATGDGHAADMVRRKRETSP